ncbi:type I restriction-modification enzyme R subunit C-terminal domain-containing protein [Brevundimonas diminuta]|uniref:type I restriction-modification enzyme R subunit C-terminal domain-containing protein n=1 Tax=Brevundimonas diminuta TaxID=293 RepID=UPI003D9A986D
MVVDRRRRRGEVLNPIEVQNEGGLGAFLRSLVGFDRAAAKGAFSDFISDKAVSANQIEFIDMIVNALSENGLIDPEMFYESPFTDIDDQGIVGVFGVEKAKEIISIVRRLNAAVAA